MNDPTTMLQKAARLLADGDVTTARTLMQQADALLEQPGHATPEATYRARIALAAAVAALAVGDADRCEGKLSEAFRLLGIE
ncbi:MAG TPA: hypothetical protein VKA46_33845 [Gemmataceae bacterium]|nr:hypothetical protein [Gemmataceae bacterium]